MALCLIEPVLSYSSTNIYLIDDSLVDLCRSQMGERKSVIIADEFIKELYADSLAKLLHIDLFTVPSGEQAKSQETKSLIEQKLFEGGYGRDTTLIAMGGGATTDIVGFIASTYLRGVDLIFIPTTLLAMIDAAIGGKTAINTSFGKNLLGTFYHPRAILIDPKMLTSLPEKELMNGLAESLKMGLILDFALWELIEKNLPNETFFLKDPSFILRNIEDKMSIVQQDPLETGMRRILNFGHTIGHAIEALSHYEMAHGKAVALGCLVEAHLSKELGYLSCEDFERILSLYSNFPVSLPKNYSRKAFFDKLSYDKKSKDGEVRFVLIDKIGQALSFEGSYCRSVCREELEPSLLWMELHYG